MLENLRLDCKNQVFGKISNVVKHSCDTTEGWKEGEHEKTIRAAMFYLPQNRCKLQKLKRYLDIFFFECLLPMSEGDLKSIKTRMFALCRRLTIVIHGPKCFSSSKNAQEQKAMKRKLIPSLLNNFFSSGRNLFDYFEALISVE